MIETNRVYWVKFEGKGPSLILHFDSSPESIDVTRGLYFLEATHEGRLDHEAVKMAIGMANRGIPEPAFGRIASFTYADGTISIGMSTVLTVGVSPVKPSA